jgi:tRNA U34 5-carboxymethylaminomethyl modifying enzyme MnmG/GidA
VLNCTVTRPPPLIPHTTPTTQGFSTGLPERLQLTLLRTLPGLEACAMLRPAYAVEYDYLPAHQVTWQRIEQGL